MYILTFFSFCTISNTIPMFLLGYISTKNADSKLYKPINMQD